MEKFSCKLNSDMNWPSKLETQNGMVLDFSKPPEYNGLNNTLTPEDAFVSSIIMCLACTFDSYATKMRLKIKGYESEGTGTVDRVDGVLKFSELRVSVRISIPEETNTESVRKAFEKARNNCLVAASVNTPIEYDAQILTEKN